MVFVKAEKLDETMDCAMVKKRAFVRECEQVEKLVVWKVFWSEFLAVAKMASSMDIVGADSKVACSELKTAALMVTR